MQQPDQEILTLQEMAGYLRIAERSVLRMAQAGELPGTKVASQWRFMRSVVDDWLINRMREVPRGRLVDLIESGDGALPLSRLGSTGLVNLEIRPGSKREVLDQLIEPLVRAGLLADREDFLQGLLAREELVSTGLENGVALPHLREPQEYPFREPLLAVGVCREGTEFDALDGRPTRLFLLACATTLESHLKLMARIALVLRRPGLVARLVEAPSAVQVMALLLEAEQRLREEAASEIRPLEEGERHLPDPGVRPLGEDGRHPASPE